MESRKPRSRSACGDVPAYLNSRLYLILGFAAIAAVVSVFFALEQLLPRHWVVALVVRGSFGVILLWGLNQLRVRMETVLEAAEGSDWVKKRQVQAVEALKGGEALSREDRQLLCNLLEEKRDEPQAQQGKEVLMGAEALSAEDTRFLLTLLPQKLLRDVAEREVLEKDREAQIIKARETADRNMQELLREEEALEAQRRAAAEASRAAAAASKRKAKGNK
jgi:hypothetical protein